MIRQGGGKEPAGLRLFPKGNKYGHSDSIIRSSWIVCGAYAFAPLQTGLRPSTSSSAPVPCRGYLWGVCNTPLYRGLRPSTSFSAPVPCRGHLWGVFNTPLQTGLRPSTPSPVPVPYRGHLGGVCNTPLRRGLHPHTLGRGCQHPPPLNGLMRSVIQVCGSAVGARGVGEGRYGACLGLKWSTCHLLI